MVKTERRAEFIVVMVVAGGGTIVAIVIAMDKILFLWMSMILSVKEMDRNEYQIYNRRC